MTAQAWFVPAVRRGPAPTATENGRAVRRGTVQVGGGVFGTESVALPFATPGPGDVRSLRSGAARRKVPVPGTVAAEEEQRPYVELAAEDLPWRYSPGPDGGARLRPWLVLVVGTTVEVVVQGSRARLSPDAQSAHPLTQAALWAHVQRDGSDAPSGSGVARVLCGRTFAAGETFPADTDHVAALVVPWTPQGDAAWGAPGAGHVEVPCLLSWTFRTGPPRGFRDLARELRGADDDALGTVDVVLDDAGTSVAVAGALTSISSAPLPVAPEVFRHDLLSAETDGPHPVVGPPAYGAPWIRHERVRGLVAAAAGSDEPTWAWPVQANADLRRRVVAGVGRRAGIELQEEVVAAAARVWRAGPAVAEIVSTLALGLAASGALWRGRLPDSTPAQLRLLGPATGRLVTARPDGNPGPTLRRALRAPEGATLGSYPVGLLGPLTGRVLVAGGPAARFARPGAADGRALVDAAVRPGAVPERPRDETEAGAAPEELDAGHLDTLVAEAERGWGAAAAERALRRLRFERRVETDVRPGGEPPPPPVPVDLGLLAEHLVGALDPEGGDPPALRRVRGRITGLDPARLLAPLEDCPDLDLPAWRYLRDRARHWLLPGADTLASGEVVALRSNPEFIEAFLLGLNEQALAELRWRQHPVRAGCTPLRRFWDRLPAGDGARRDDVDGVARWVDATGTPVERLGSHAPTGVEQERLVVVIRSELFHRYPRTLVSLAPDGEHRPAALDQREWPEFVAALSDDLVMFAFGTDPDDAVRRWVVVEEVPDGIRFGVHPPGGPGLAPTDAAGYAAAHLLRPVRVLLKGSETLAGGGP